MHTWTLAGLISSLFYILPLWAEEPAKDTNSHIVVVEGVGASPEEAIKDAFRNAVLQVGGSVIETESQIKKFELINEEEVVLIDNEIDGSRKRNGSIYRVGLKAEVEKISLLAKRRSSKVVMDFVDQNALITKTLIEFRSRKDASAIFKKQFEAFPQSCLSATVIGEPRVIEKDSQNATIEIIVQVEPDKRACMTLWKNLKSALHTMDFGYRGSSFYSGFYPRNNARDYWNLELQSEFAKNGKCDWMVWSYEDEIPSSTDKDSLLESPISPSKSIFWEDTDFLNVEVDCTGSAGSKAYTTHRLDPSLKEKMEQLLKKNGCVSLELIDSKSERIAVAKMNLHQPLMNMCKRNGSAIYFLNFTFVGMLHEGRPHSYTHAIKTPFRITLSLEQLKAINDIQVDVQFEE